MPDPVTATLSEASRLLASGAAAQSGRPYTINGGDGGDPAAPAGFSPVVAAGFAVNFIFGAGVLGVPYSFVHAGVLVSVLLLLLASVISSWSMTWIAEVMGRSEALQRHREDSHRAPHSFAITGRSVGVTVASLCGEFLGPWGLRVYQGAIFFYSMASMWLYSTVFALSLLSLVPLPLGGVADTRDCDVAEGLTGVPHACREAYAIYVLLYAALMAVIVSFDLREQKGIQMALTVTGVSCVCIMILTAVMALALGAESAADPEDGDYLPLVDKSGFAKAFSCFLFAQLAQHGAPALTLLVEKKEQARTVFAGTFAFTFVFYTMLGLSCAALFKHGVQSMVTLNWTSYTAESSVAPWYAALLSVVVRTFPAVSVSAAYPIYAINLGDTFVMEGVKPVLRRWMFMILPAIGAMMQSNVVSILAVTGLFGYLIAFIMPALLQLRSSERCEEMLGATATPCSSYFSGVLPTKGVLYFASAGLFVSTVLLVVG